ncbi:MAG: hypothetical protein GY816_03815 [Cytophagales bacterium]|nr:hypothetical protein [Cytophagales bacterium]
MWRFIFSGVLFFSAFWTQAQETEDLIILEEEPTIALRYLQINYNGLRLAENALNKPKTSQEMQAEVGLLKRYSLVADIGFANTSRGRTYDYESKGSFWRAGIDVNMSSNVESGDFIGMGLRYAKANFEDKISFDQTTEAQDGSSVIQNLAYANPNLSSEWMELVFKMRVNIWKQFYTGYTMRYQFYNQLNGADAELKPLDIPGYGKTTRPNSFGFDYYVGWRLSFK